MFTFIEIDRIEPHPDNPRKDLGDLTELAESIKINGVLQNLTVIPWNEVHPNEPLKQDYYTVIIGHRRLAAAKLAGNAAVPCIITNMSLRGQIATMLLENMQRNDLTVFEQAKGFQMMLDFGETVNDIAERTGFSETTIRRRVKLLELDQEKLEKSVERGATLQDYADLNKIEDIALRNHVLDKIGTSNFTWELQKAIDKEKRDKVIAGIVTELEKFATKVEDTDGLQPVKYYYASHNPTVEIPDDADNKEYFFIASEYGYVTLYTKGISTTPVAINESYLAKQKENQEHHAALDEISKRAYQLRREFILNYSNTEAKAHIGAIIEYFIWNLFYDDCYLDCENLAETLNFEANEEDDEWNFDSIIEQVKAKPEYHLLVTVYLALDTGHEHYYSWDNQHVENKALNAVYGLLEKLGYQMSDEERQLQDGTHELFAVKE